jgi:hypothetical protein
MTNRLLPLSSKTTAQHAPSRTTRAIREYAEWCEASNGQLAADVHYASQTIMNLSAYFVRFMGLYM